MKHVARKISITIRSSLFCFMVGSLGVSHSLQAAELNISQMPLFLNQTVSPNVFFEFDDSGSMDWDILTTPFWHYCAYDNQAYGTGGNANCGSFLTQGRWRGYTTSSGSDRDFVYLYDSGNDAYGNNDCRDGWSYYNRSVERCGWNSGTATADWRLYSSSLNVMYYNPDVEYGPWKGVCTNGGADCADADFNRVRANPRQGESGYSTYRDLDDFTYHIWRDDKGYDENDNRPRRGRNFNQTDGPNELVDLWDSHATVSISGTQATWTVTSYAPDPNRRNLGMNPSTVESRTLSGATCHPELGGGVTPCRTIDEAKQNIANWFQYYRRRMYIVKVAISDIIDANPSFRYGASVINKWSGSDHIFHEVPPAGAVSHVPYNATLLERIYTFNQPAMGTPLRTGLERTGKYFDAELSGKTDPIIFECQKNFSILFTDGYYNGNSPASAIGDADGDGVYRTVADVAKYYYDKDLSPLADEVPIDAFDDNTKQHMVTFTAALGVFGLLEDLTGDGWPNLNGNTNHTLNESGQTITVDTGDVVNPGTGNWSDANFDPESNSDDPVKIDDLWHAAYNARGIFTVARNPQELVEDLVEAITNIQSRLSSSAAVALNSGTLDANSRIYQARFDSTDWTGKLESIPISDGTSCGGRPKGELCGVEWEASDVLRSKSHLARNIHTSDPSKPVDQRKIPFQWANLSDAQKLALNTNPDTGLDDGEGESRLNFLRGDDSKEADQSGGIFRVRSGNKLGDIINSSPIFVGPPIFSYGNSFEPKKYSTYREDNKGRKGLVYVGSNDGLFHAFNGNTGEEVYAYVPSKLIPNMTKLTSQNYQHQYYVNGLISRGDAFINNDWGTFVTASLGPGEQGLFALDVTNPNNLGSHSVMWEVRDDDPVNDFSDVGNIMGRAHIVKLNNGKWAVVFGNGYNSTKADGSVGSGNAVLYVVDLKDGSLIVPPISTGFGSAAADDPLGLGRPNGLGEVTPIDIDGDKLVDYIYGGDLFGNVWKFDLRGTAESAWGPAFGNRVPLFTAKDDDNGSRIAQAVTSAVSVATHPENRERSLIFFGTGKYFEINDNTVLPGSQTQTFYAVYDKHEANHHSLTRADNFVEQEIYNEEERHGVAYRRVSHPDDGERYKLDWSRHNGWMMDLVDMSTNPLDGMGERVIVKPFFRGNRIIFITLIPSDNPCRDGGDGWIMELDYRHGGRLPISPFDVNNDGIINGDDVYNSKAYGGAKIEGIPTTPGVLNDPTSGQDGGAGSELKIISTSRSGDNIDVITESSAQRYYRSSWRIFK